MFTRWMSRIGVLAAVCIPAAAETYFVKVGGTGDGTEDFDNAYGDLQSALAIAQSGDEIWVAAVTYKPSVRYPDNSDDRRKTFRIRSGISVFGGFVGLQSEDELTDRNPEINETILDGNIDTSGNNDCYHVVYIDDGQATNTKLSGFTIRNAYANGSGIDARGAGLLINVPDTDGGGAALDRLFFVDNYATGGGAAASIEGEFITYAANCRFESNSSANGDGGAVLLLPQTVVFPKVA